MIFLTEFFFLSGSGGFTPPSPNLSGPTTRKAHFFICVFPKEKTQNFFGRTTKTGWGGCKPPEPMRKNIKEEIYEQICMYH